MVKTSIQVGIKSFRKYADSGLLNLDCPVQRQSNLWTNLNKSLLIHSILADYIVPHIYLQKEIVDNNSILSVIDGLQRITICLSFIDDEWSLHSKTPNVVIDGVEYDIALKKFSELDEDVKSAILAFRFSTYQLENCTDEEIEEIFARLNSGVPLSKIQMARPKLGIELSAFFNDLKEHPFFQNSLNMTLPMLRREDDFLMLLTTVMLMNSLYYKDYVMGNSASAGEVVKFVDSLEKGYPDEKRADITHLVEYLDECFGGVAEPYKWLRKNNIPIVCYCAWQSIVYEIPAEEFRDSILSFFEEDNVTDRYKYASGSGNVKMVNVNVRIEELMNYVISRHGDESVSSKYSEDTADNSVTEQVAE